MRLIPSPTNEQHVNSDKDIHRYIHQLKRCACACIGLPPGASIEEPAHVQHIEELLRVCAVPVVQTSLLVILYWPDDVHVDSQPDGHELEDHSAPQDHIDLLEDTDCLQHC